MNKFLERIVFDGALIIFLFGIFGFVIKNYLSKLVNSSIEKNLQKRKMDLEIKKEKELSKLKEINKFYPIILESAYRTRNEVREFLKDIDILSKKREDRKLMKKTIEFINKLDLRIDEMEDLIFKSYSVLDKTVHTNFHEYKNLIKKHLYVELKALKKYLGRNKVDYLLIAEKVEVMKKYLIEIENYFATITGDVKNEVKN